MFKKIIYTLLIICGSISFSYANEDIKVSVSKSNIELGEMLHFNIEIDVTEINLEEFGIEIPGLDSFQVFAKTQGTNYKDINGVTESFSTFTLQLSPIDEGIVSLGPVKLMIGSGTIIDDEIITVHVGSSIQQDITPSIEDKKKEDIKDIRREDFPIALIIAMIFSVVGVLYLIYILFKKNQNKRIIKIDNQESDENIYKTYILLFKKLNTSIGKIHSQDFFKQYNIGVRKILLHQNISNALTATLSELKNNSQLQQDEFFSLLKKSYSYEYSSKEVTQQTQKKYIQDIIMLLKK